MIIIIIKSTDSRGRRPADARVGQHSDAALPPEPAQVQRGGGHHPTAGEGPAGHPQDGAGAQDGALQGKRVEILGQCLTP